MSLLPSTLKPHTNLFASRPDHCDGTYDSSCDPSRAYTDITSILSSMAPDTLSYMQTYWKDYQGNDESFWEHEWSKHGTCISTLNPSCYTNYQRGEEAADFFTKAVSLFKALPTYDWLAAAGITPSNTATYTADQIQSALQAQFGKAVIIGCSSGVLDEVWYGYNVRGSIQTGSFEAADPDGTKSSCPATGIKYPLKSASTTSGGTTLSTATKTSTSTSVAPTSTSVFSGKGYLNAVTSGATKGCIISGGTWYTTGTCATFTATASGSGFTLKSSKGLCAVSNGALTCASSVTTGTVFSHQGSNLAYTLSGKWYADAVPSGSTQGTVYTSSSHAVNLTIVWQGI